MGLQKFRCDETREPCANGAAPCYTNWMGGPTLALVRDCPTPFGPRTVYATNHPDTWFSIPAACTFKGKTVRGYLTCEDGLWAFRAYSDSYWFPHVREEN
jgi:hypothetical protein